MCVEGHCTHDNFPFPSIKHINIKIDFYKSFLIKTIVLVSVEKRYKYAHLYLLRRNKTNNPLNVSFIKVR